MKRITLLVYRTFSGAFLATFCISVFVFLMIFVFVYIDEFIGKNIGVAAFSKLFFLFSLNTIPKALPLALLLASIMATGRMSEYYEITALQSAGISIYRIFRPLLVFAIMMSAFLFGFTDRILSISNLKLQTQLMSIRSSKPSLLFKEGAFNNELSGYSIRIGSLSKDEQSIGTILIYDHTDQSGNNTVITADSGRILHPTENSLQFELYHGNSYKENGEQAGKELVRESFEQYTLQFDLSEFGLKKMNENNYKTDVATLTLTGISNFIDGLEGQYKQLITQKGIKDLSTRLEINRNNRIQYQLEWHKRFSLAISCLLLLLIGAPMGALLRKGGLGLPMVVSTVLYIIYHVISITGEKLAEEETIAAWLGAWLSTLILFPVAMGLWWKIGTARN